MQYTVYKHGSAYEHQTISHVWLQLRSLQTIAYSSVHQRKYFLLSVVVNLGTYDLLALFMID